jgi:membrane-bound serine protease (ClpP class)
VSEWLNPTLLAWVYSLGLLILGFVLILLEIFVIPGMNIFGILGFGTVCIGIGFAYNKVGTEAAVLIGVLGMVGTVSLVWLLVRNRAWQRMVLNTETDRASGFDSAPAGLAELVTRLGVTLTPLRPAGRAQFGDEPIDVVTEGGFIERDARVEVVAVHGARVIVQRAAEETP